jgi:phage-related protein
MTFAIYSKVANVVRVHYSHLTEDQAENEVQRLNSHLQSAGQTAVFWAEQHHPECVFVIG